MIFSYSIQFLKVEISKNIIERVSEISMKTLEICRNYFIKYSLTNSYSILRKANKYVKSFL